MVGFNDSPFDDLVNQFFGGGGRRVHYSDNTDSRNSVPGLLESIDLKKQKFFIFDFSSDSVMDVLVVDGLEENEYGEEVHNGRKMLEIILKSGKKPRFMLPKNVGRGKVDWTIQNGILEVSLRK